MSVILMGMNMPDCCNNCRLSVCRKQPDGQYIVQCQALEEGDDDVIEWRGEGSRKRLDNCPLEVDG